MKWTLSFLVVLATLVIQANGGVARAGQAREVGWVSPYDMTKKVTIEGHITKVELPTSTGNRTPIRIGLNVKDQNGRITNWTVEGPTPGQLSSSGLAELLKIGARLKVIGSPLKEDRKLSTASADWFGKERIYGTTFTLADDREFSWP